MPYSAVSEWWVPETAAVRGLSSGRHALIPASEFGTAWYVESLFVDQADPTGTPSMILTLNNGFVDVDIFEWHNTNIARQSTMVPAPFIIRPEWHLDIQVSSGSISAHASLWLVPDRSTQPIQ